MAPSRFVDDLGITHDRIGDGYLNIGSRQNAGASNANVSHFSTVAGIQDDKITNFIGRVRHDEHTGKQVSQSILGRKTNRYTHDACRGQPGRHVDIPGRKKHVNSQY